MSTPLETIQPIPQGARITEQAFRDYITDPANFNDLELADRVALVAAAVSALPVTTRAASIPAAARVGDWFIDTTANNQLYICVTTYTSGGVLATNWRAISDATAQAAAAAAAITAGTATQTVLSDTMPVSANAGWIWVKTGGGLNYTYACSASYESGAGIEPGEIGSQWSLVNDVDAALLAATEQGLKDSKTNTFVLSAVPAEADARDMWVNTNDNSNWVALRSYTTTDGDAFNSGTTYAEGDFVRVGNDYYIADVTTTGNTPPHADWTLYGTYASKTLFRESQWIATADVVAQDAIDALAIVAAGKSTVYYGTSMPNPDGGVVKGDIWVDQATGYAYTCKVAYAHDGGVFATNWEQIKDGSAQGLISDQALVLDGKKSIFYQNDPPIVADVRDLWIDTNNRNQAYINARVGYIATDGDSHSPSVPYTQGDIRISGSAYYQAKTDLTAHAFNAAEWDIVGTKTTAGYSSSATYSVDDTVTYGGAIFRNLKAIPVALDPEVTDPATEPTYWEQASATSTAIDIFRAENWKRTIDKRAQDIGDAANTLADGKSVSYYQQDVPAQADVGDLWTDTNNPYTPGGVDYLQYRCKTAYTTGGSLSNWEVYTDPVALALANEVNALVDHKRTTFTTAVAEPAILWPGSGRNAGQTPITYWDTLPAGEGTEAGHIARVGDLWINYTGTAPALVPSTRVCVKGYAGDAVNDPGSMACWVSSSEDAVTAATYLRLAGGTMAGAIDFTAVAANQVFRGKTLVVGTPTANPGTGDAAIARDAFIERDLAVTRDAVITGNLTVHGTQTIVDSQTVEIGDSQIKLAKDNPANITDIGLYGKYAASGTKFAGITYKAADKSFLLYNELTTEPGTTVDAGANPAPVTVGKVTVDSDHATDAIDLGGKKGVGSGAPSADTDLDTVGARNSAIGSAVSSGMPIGTVVATLLAAAPTGWVLCQGQIVSQTGTYAALWAAMGSTHMFAGNPGGGNFFLPDLRSRVAVGKATDTSVLNTLGAYGGEQTVTLGVEKLPEHTHDEAGSHGHTVTDNAHTHAVYAGTTPGSSGETFQRVGYTGTDGVQLTDTAGATTGISIVDGGEHTHDSVGSGEAHENMQPYLVLNYMIKIA